MQAPLLARALALAVTAHAGQSRKGGRVPYATHPLRVVGRVHAWGVADEEILAAAALHDVLEDTDVTEEDLARETTPRVLDLVRALTHPPGLAPRKRTEAILGALARAPLEAVLVKLADRLDNVQEMPGWRASSRVGYLGESQEVARLAEARLVARDGDEATRAALGRALAEYEPIVGDLRRAAERDLALEGRRARAR